MICKKCKKDIPDGALYCNFCGAKQTTPTRKPKIRGNGQGSVYKRGDKWAASITRYRKGQRLTKTKSGFVKKIDALDWINEQKLSKIRNETTLESLYKLWSTSSMLKLSNSKQTAYKIAWGRIKPIAYDNIGDIVIADLQDIITGLTYYPARDVKTLLSHLYKRAQAQGDVPSNLAAFIELPELTEAESIPYTKDELTRMWKSFSDGDMFIGYMLLMIYSGMMPGELLKCKKDMIDYKDQTITGCGMKTKERRTKPIVFASFITPVLKKLCGSTGGEYLVDAKKNDFYDLYHEAQKRIEIRDLTPYSCRHTTATALALGDAAAPGIIARVMRQTRPITTQRYTHADVQAVRDVVDGMQNNPLTVPPEKCL